MGTLDDYLRLIEAERNARPSEARLADEIHRLRAALEAVETERHGHPAGVATGDPGCPVCAIVSNALGGLPHERT